MYVKKGFATLLTMILAVAFFTACGRWDYSREAVKAANDAQGETLRVEFKVSQAFTDALRSAVADSIQPADIEKTITMDKTVEKLLTSGYRLDVYALRADVDADKAAAQLAGEFIARLAGCEDEGFISMVKADNGYFYEAVLTYRHGGSGDGSGSSGGDGDGGDNQPDEPEEPMLKYAVQWYPDAADGQRAGTLIFRTVDNVTASDLMESSSMSLNAIKTGLAAGQYKSNPEELEKFDLEKVVHLIVEEGSGVTEIGSNIFASGRFDAVESIKLSSEVETIGEKAFFNCKNLTTVDMPGVKTIGYSAFNGCSSLKNVTLTNVTDIQSYAFISCTALTNVSITTTGALTISEAGFSTCTSLENVYISAGSIVLKGGYNYGLGLRIPAGVFTQCPKLDTVILNGQLKEVGECTFGLADLAGNGDGDIPMVTNSAVHIYCTGGKETFMEACGKLNLANDIGIESEGQICDLTSQSM
ncbi:MAG TPA: leucine-rich repeat domain-containing protein [Candidatus Faecalibacterium faecipullorum]|uniref:Leucine-rich repeat domain-containing protein n=1 Tax=Candidatus Faecalibacterium faecipullorum TaxID=2838578 RepID=A0A9D2MGS7_9FIRM|nr:leucine-rich repeat domain-containing protein [Candidatus Faecalibacterium faecipullorum]